MRKYNKLIIWALAVIGVSLSSCDDIFEKLAVNPNQQDVSSFYNTPMGHRTKRILRIERKEYQTY